MGNCHMMEAFGLRAEDHTMLVTPMVHITGSAILLLAPLWLGGKVTIVPAFDPAVVLDTWERQRHQLPSWRCPHVSRALAEQKARPRRITTGRLALAGGDAVPVSLQEDYGATSDIRWWRASV